VNELLWWVALGAIILAAALLYAYFTQVVRRPPTKALPPGTSVRYTAHAKERMSQRGITAEQVEAVLADPERVNPDPEEHSVRLERAFVGRILKVWVAEPWPADEIVVKTTAWQYLMTINIPVGSIGRVIGHKGETIQAIRKSTGAHIIVNDDGTVRISAGDQPSATTAKQEIMRLVSRPTVKLGERHWGTVAKIVPHGAIVSLPTGGEGMLPVAKLRPLVGGERIEDIHDGVAIGMRIQVEIDEVRDGRPRLVAVRDGDRGDAL